FMSSGGKRIRQGSRDCRETEPPEPPYPDPEGGPGHWPNPPSRNPSTPRPRRSKAQFCLPALAFAGQQLGHGSTCPVSGQIYPSDLATLAGAFALAALQHVVSVLAGVGETTIKAKNVVKEMKSIGQPPLGSIARIS